MTRDAAALPCEYRNTVAGPPGLAVVGEPNDREPAPVVLRCRIHDEAWPCPHDNGAPRPRPRGRRSHILRESPPWRQLAPGARLRTECGKTTGDGKVVVIGTRAELIETIRAEGRGVLEEVCKVCRSRSDLHAHASWQGDPGALIVRDIDPFSSAASDQLTAELHALAGLAAAHPEEFAALVTAAVPALAARREARREAGG
ncbi:hypothetical protein [Actinomadura sp. 3N407]|uniref:hypothetical protein n=1 Tax=Actinomadura sp. 3N407 TaxID=3457423 RepID=UPI003FCEE0CD